MSPSIHFTFLFRPQISLSDHHSHPFELPSFVMIRRAVGSTPLDVRNSFKSSSVQENVRFPMNRVFPDCKTIVELTPVKSFYTTFCIFCFSFFGRGSGSGRRLFGSCFLLFILITVIFITVFYRERFKMNQQS